MADEEERLSDGSIGLVARKRRPADSMADIRSDPDASRRIEALLTRLEGPLDPVARGRIFVEIAITFRDDLEDDDQAIDALLEAWQADPQNDDVLDHLEPLLRQTRLAGAERWTELLNLTRNLAAAERDPARALPYNEAMVRWHTRDLPDAELARQWVERVRVIDPTHALVHFMQAALSREHGDFKREIDELDLAVLSTRRKDERVAIHLILASRYLDERTLNRVEAKKQYERAHRLFPRMMDPLRGLEQVALLEGDKKALADVLRLQADGDVEEADRIEILLRLAALEEDEFRRPELAARTLERVSVRAPDRPGVLDALERCYRAARMWPELAGLLERAVSSESSPDERAARLKRLGEVLEAKLGDVRSALATYQRLAASMPEDEVVLGEVARLAEKVSDVPLAVQARERLATLAVDPAAKARHHLIAGQLLTPIDAAEATRQMERAVAADPSNTSAWNALLWDARAENDHPRAARYLEERARATDAPRVRASCFVELAELRARMGSGAGERAAWEEAIRADPSNEPAAAALLPRYLAEGKFAEAEPLSVVVIAAAERDRDSFRLYGALRAQTEIAFALAKPDLALRASLAAFDVKRESDEARQNLVRAASEMRADPEVLGARDSLVAIADAPEGLSVESRLALGEVLNLIGEAQRASVLFDEVLVERPDDARALAGLSQYHAASGNRVAALSLKRQRALAIADPAERLETLLETAESLARIDEPNLAADVYESARELAPNDLSILHKLVALYQKLSKWVSLFDVLRTIASVDTDPRRRAKTLFTMGEIAAVELMDRGTALELFDKSLDADASALEAFERIGRILTEARDWPGLERMYEKMIARADGRGDRELAQLLVKQLGLVYRDRIGDVPRAIEALQSAVRLKPEDDEAQQMLRELLALTGQVSGALAVTLEHVLQDTLDPRPYPALFELLVSQNARDRALCVASAMTFLDIEHPTAQGWRQSYPQPPIEGIVLDLGAEGYRQLLHPELDPNLTTIFETLAPAVVEIALSRLSLRERISHPGPSLKGYDWLGKMAARAAVILGAPPPRLFARRIPGPTLAVAPAKSPSILVHPSGLAGIPRDVLAFLLGKRALEATPTFLTRALYPSVSELKSLVASAARIATDAAEPIDQPLKDRLRRDDVARIAAAVGDARGRGGKLDVTRWSQAADLSLSYGGLLLAGDLEAARAAIAIEPQAPGDVSPREKMRQLVAWYLGDACAALRQKLAVALQ